MTNPQSAAPQRCGVIGLGMIGAGVAERLIRKGGQVRGYDVRPAAIAQIKGRNSDVIRVSVVNGEQAREVLFDKHGIAEAVYPNRVVALMATIRVPTVLEL